MSQNLVWMSPEVDDLTSAAAHAHVFAPGRRVKVIDVRIQISTTVAGDATAPVITFTETSAGDFGSITVPDATAAGSVVVDNAHASSTVFPQVLEAGEKITIAVATAATDSGTAAGAGYYSITYQDMDDIVANVDAMSESA